MLAAILLLAWRPWATGAGEHPPILYTTEGGPGVAEGVVDSPLTVTVRVPWSPDSPDTTPVHVALQLLDEEGNPARFGPVTAPLLLMRSTLDTSIWRYDGSVPSVPGVYSARVQVTRVGTGQGSPHPRSLTLPASTLLAKPEDAPPLVSGYVFPHDGDLWLLSSDATRQRRLTFFALSVGQHASYPKWSPDGGSIAFTYLPERPTSELPRTEIWAISADRRDLRKLVEAAPDETLSVPAWSADGRYIYFSVDRMSNEPIPSGAPMDEYRRVDRVDLETGTRTQVALGAQFPSTGGPDGDLLYLGDTPPTERGGSPGQQLVLVRPDGQRTVLVPPMIYQQMAAPALSPDGKWVVFSATNDSPPKEGFQVPSSKFQVPSSRFQVEEPSLTIEPGTWNIWSWLTFAPSTVHAHELPWDLFLVPATGGEVAQLTRMDEDVPFPIWLDNLALAFLGETGLYKLNLHPDGSPADQPLKLYEGIEHGSVDWHAP